MVGGGEGARHKASLLHKAGASLVMVAEQLHPSTEQFLSETGIRYLAQAYAPELLAECRLVVAAADEATNRQVAADARARGLFVNVVDTPDISDFFFASVVDRDPIIVAIGSDGRAPVMVRHVRALVESSLPASVGQLASLVERFRERVRQRFTSIEQRRRFWDFHLVGAAAEKVFSGRSDEADRILEQDLARPGQYAQGEVYLVGAGPGDPDLLTFKALRLMQQADVVLYDRLVSDEILERVRRESERICVGKGRNIYSVTQDNINEFMATLAGEGKRVLRLKGGDPFIFGRGGEELAYLADRGIPFQVVPGITAASGCAAYAGIPLTHREYAQSVRFITGHRVGGELNFDWQEFVKPAQTLVFYMGLNGLELICAKLLEYGMPPDMPAALVEKGTRVDQRVFTGNLVDLPAIVREAEAQAPTLLIVGEVVSLHQQLAWWHI